jgi:4'-phosphopantetheinyl transferase
MTSIPPVWQDPPATLTLGRDEVHVWRVELNQPPAVLAALRQTLMADEQSRADRFYFQHDREHFVVARGALRAILGRYLGVDPRRPQFSYGPQGKPSLTAEWGGENLRFNLSHSHELALCAVTQGREVGIDVEQIRGDRAGREIAEHFFSRREVAALRVLPPEQWDQAFFNCWTRKESYIKARGEGLSLPLDKFDVSLAPGEPAALLAALGDPREVMRWKLEALEPGPGYAGAIAVEGQSWELRCWRWSAPAG